MDGTNQMMLPGVQEVLIQMQKKKKKSFIVFQLCSEQL